MHDANKKRVVLGGGVAGVYPCAALEKVQRNDVEVVLVNKENHVVFQPLLPEVISGQIWSIDSTSRTWAPSPKRGVAAQYRGLPELRRSFEAKSTERARVEASPPS